MEYTDSRHNPKMHNGKIKIHPKTAFQKMQKAGKLAAQALNTIAQFATPGTKTEKLNNILNQFARDHNAIPAPLNYKGFPKSLCTSVNHVVCHGIPGEKILKDGDIVNIDVTLIVDGWHGDTSKTIPIGNISRKAERLINITKQALIHGIEAVKPGATTGDIGHAIQKFAEKNRCAVVRDFCGHGIGQLFHDAPNILHYGKPGEGYLLKEGMFFTIEPMLNLGNPHVKILQTDGWTAVTRDKSLSAQFEHTVGVSDTGACIFTLLDDG